MKRKKILLLVAITLVFILSVGFVSCGSDNDDVTVNTQLIGLWKTSMGSSNWKYILLQNDGNMYYGGNAENIDREVTVSMEPVVNGNTPNSSVIVGDKKAPNAHWSYNDSEQTISMYTDNGYYAFTYKVNMSVDGKSWAGYDSASGRTYSFIKVE